jgi:hypothetical protein
VVGWRWRLASVVDKTHGQDAPATRQLPYRLTQRTSLDCDARTRTSENVANIYLGSSPTSGGMLAEIPRAVNISQ